MIPSAAGGATARQCRRKPVIDRATRSSMDREAVHMRVAVNLATAIVVATTVLSGCSSSDDSAAPVANGISTTTSASATSAPAPDIVISNYGYAVRGPVKAGQQVTVVNDDQANHSLASNSNDAFDVRVSGGGGIATLTAPMTPGTYEFHCKYHANMHGALIVQ